MRPADSTVTPIYGPAKTNANTYRGAFTNHFKNGTLYLIANAVSAKLLIDFKSTPFLDVAGAFTINDLEFTSPDLYSQKTLLRMTQWINGSSSLISELPADHRTPGHVTICRFDSPTPGRIKHG